MQCQKLKTYMETGRVMFLLHHQQIYMALTGDVKTVAIFAAVFSFTAE